MKAWHPLIAPVAIDNTSRLIPGPVVSDLDHALADLVDLPTDLDALTRLSALTNPRLLAQTERHPAGVNRSDLVFNVPFSKIVNGSFANPGQGARFHSADGAIGAWYCAVELQTAVAEVSYHRIAHLNESGLTEEPNVVYREFLADIHAQDFAYLINDNSKQARACLDPDSYVAGQELGTQLRLTGAGGVIYPSVRHTGGTNLAVLQAPIVSNVRQASLVQFSILNNRIENCTVTAAD